MQYIMRETSTGHILFKISEQGHNVNLLTKFCTYCSSAFLSYEWIWFKRIHHLLTCNTDVILSSTIQWVIFSKSSLQSLNQLWFIWKEKKNDFTKLVFKLLVGLLITQKVLVSQLCTLLLYVQLYIKKNRN